ncbi:hypothetical protein PFMC_03890 [Plasmodium falciparum CAMP/Malaysia]|uniref:Uncharacterized protein n=1 Tax=Plasmodium falciparum (isolate Camp / Malaysia) TaxID=5835 RepID=A0A024X4C3_PLAFC|nr:hypothetical protein PFMC_03890 [Plasmodium falciparum CAMP/Malaysia]
MINKRKIQKKIYREMIIISKKKKKKNVKYIFSKYINYWGFFSLKCNIRKKEKIRDYYIVYIE